jgi:hypothetical protein
MINFKKEPQNLDQFEEYCLTKINGDITKHPDLLLNIMKHLFDYANKLGIKGERYSHLQIKISPEKNTIITCLKEKEKWEEIT